MSEWQPIETALKEKDSCARHCEGPAYRAEAKRLRALNAELMEAASMGKDEPLLRQALEALQNSAVKHPQQIEQRNNAIVALRERLGEE